MPSTAPSRPPRVLHLITHLAVGGAQMNTLHTVRHLRDQGWEVELLSGPLPADGGATLMDEARELGVPLAVEPTLVRDLDPLLDLQAVLRLAARIRRGRFDVVHTHSSKAGLLGRLAAALVGVPVIVHTVHGWGFHDHQAPRARWVYQQAERAASLITSRLITVSDRDARVGLSVGIGAPGTYRTIRSGIDLERFGGAAPDVAALRAELGIAAHAPVIGTVARLCDQKDPLAFVRAAEIIAAERPDAHFLVVGDGPMRAEVEAAARAAGLAGRFVISGFRADVPDLLRIFDVFLLTSLWEGLPRVIPEAMAAGLPVVATAVCGTAEAVAHGKTGLLVPPQAPLEAAERVLELLADPTRAAMLARAGHDDVAPVFCRDRMAEQIEELYREELGRPAPTTRVLRRPREERVRVLYLITTLEVGGAQSSLARLLSGLDRTRFEPVVACLFGGDGPTAARVRELGIRVHDLGMSHKGRVDAVARLAWLVARVRPTILQSMLFHADMLARTVGRACGVPFVVTSRRNTLIGGSHRELARRATTALDDRVIAVCEAARQAEIAYAGADPAKVVTIRNGIDTSEMPEPHGPAIERRRRSVRALGEAPVFGFVGRLHAQKGLAALLDAFRAVRVHHRDARLVLVGDGEQREDLEARARSLGLGHDVHFAGVRPDPREWMGAFDALVLPSVHEGLANVLLEGMAASLPIVATRVGGTPEVVADRETGLLVEPGSTRELSAALTALADDPEQRRRLGRAGRVRIERHFSLRSTVQNTEALYDELLHTQAAAAAC